MTQDEAKKCMRLGACVKNNGRWINVAPTYAGKDLVR